MKKLHYPSSVASGGAGRISERYIRAYKQFRLLREPVPSDDLPYSVYIVAAVMTLGEAIDHSELERRLTRPLLDAGLTQEPTTFIKFAGKHLEQKGIVERMRVVL